MTDEIKDRLKVVGTTHNCVYCQDQETGQMWCYDYKEWCRL